MFTLHGPDSQSFATYIIRMTEIFMNTTQVYKRSQPRIC